MAAAAGSSVEFVQIDGLVALKIIKHCQEESGDGVDSVQGVLLGLVAENKLEITNCFPVPRNLSDEDFEVTYQMEMMRNLRHVNVDHLHVGWYQSSYFGSFINRALIESQYGYQFSIEESVVLIYDPAKTTKGFLSLKAYRLTNTMMDLFKEQDFTPESIKQASLSFEKMFEEIPVVLRNSHLMNVLMCELEEKLPADNQYSFLDMATGSVLENNLHLLMDAVDELSQDSNKYFNYQKQYQKQQQAKHQFVSKRQLENQQRATRGEQPLPEEDMNKLFKPLPAPPRLDSLLLSGQVDVYAKQLSEFATQSFGKLFMAESLHSHGSS